MTELCGVWPSSASRIALTLACIQAFIKVAGAWRRCQRTQRPHALFYEAIWYAAA